MAPFLSQQKTLQENTENTRNKQANEKDSGKNKKGIDPEVNKSFMRKKAETKMFHVLHEVDMHACLAKQKISLDCPNYVEKNINIY